MGDLETGTNNIVKMENLDPNGQSTQKTKIIYNDKYNDVGIQVGEYTYKYVDDMFFSTYIDTCANNSTIIDIIGVYVKGQKILYTEAKTTCEQRLSFLMLPSILFTVTCSISNLLLKDYVYGNVITSVLSGTIAFILAIINYLKLDARAEAHRSSSYKYDKLLSYIQFQSGKQLFLADAKSKMMEIVTTIENNIKEIKETNPFVLPEIIRYNFPYLSEVNIFTEVKKINNQEILYKNDLTNTFNNITEIKRKIEDCKTEKMDISKLEFELNDKINKKEILIKMIIELQNKYTSIDEKFEEEIKTYINRNKYRIKICEWLKV
jgi:hypothetical protein